MRVNAFYWFMRTYVKTALLFFYRSWQIHGKENIPKNAAIIFVANHQNAFQDALVVTCGIDEAPWFLTRANVFASRFARWLFNQFHMMPVYRFRDGIKGLRNNEASMRLSADILNKRWAILLFGEGDQNMQWTLRNMQKGFARIAWMVQQENNWKLPLYVVPVGLQYDHYYNYRSRMLVNYGKAIPVGEAYKDMDERKFLVHLTDTVRDALKPLMLDIPAEHYAEIERAVRNSPAKRNMVEQLQRDQQLAATWSSNPVTVQPKSTNYALLALTFPLHAYAWLNNVIPYFIIHRFLDKKVSREFRGSVKFGMGMVLVPVFTLIQSAVVQAVFHDWRITLAYAITLPFLTGWSVDIWKKATGSR